MPVASRRASGAAGWSRPSAIRLLYGGSVGVTIALLAENAASLLASPAPVSWPAIALAALGGALAADLFTGFVHWGCDTWGDETTPWLGPGLIADFRAHHRDPEAMLEHDWIVVNGEPALAAALALVASLLPPVREWLVAHPAAWAFLWCFVLFGAPANQLHQWAHAKAAPRFVRFLQAARIVLSPAHHAIHHRHPNTSAYCISTGWLNGVLDRARFWRGAERTITRLSGAEPYRAPGDENVAVATQSRGAR